MVYIASSSQGYIVRACLKIKVRRPVTDGEDQPQTGEPATDWKNQTDRQTGRTSQTGRISHRSGGPATDRLGGLAKDW